MASLRRYIVTGLSVHLLSLLLAVDAFSVNRVAARWTGHPLYRVGRSPFSKTRINGGSQGVGSAADGHHNGELSPVITKVETVQDFLDFVAEDDRLSIVKFHANWCKTCQKFGVRYKKLAAEEGDKLKHNGVDVEQGRVRFAEVEFNTNIKLCRSLGIKRLPHIHMYKGAAGCIEDFSCGPKKFQMVIDKLNENVDSAIEDIAFRKKMDAGSDLLDDMVADLQMKFQNETRSIEPSI